MYRMPVSHNQNAGGIAEQERRHPGKDGWGTKRKFEQCETIGNASGVPGTQARTKGVVMKLLLKVLGVREKGLDIPAKIKEACETRIEAEERLKRLRATLNGEDYWFQGDTHGMSGSDSR